MEQASTENLNLENFNQSTKNGPILTSPRSIEACKRQGIDPEDLLIKTVEDMKIIYPDRIKDKKHLETKLGFYEEKRKQKLQQVKDERVLLKDLERQGLVAFDPQGFTKYAKTGQSLQKNAGANSSLIEREKKQLEKIKLRQQKEIEQMMEQEMKVQGIAEANNEKMRIDKEKEVQRQKEIQEKKKKQEEIRAQVEIEKAAKAAADLEKQKKREIELEDRQNERFLQEEQKKVEYAAILLKKEEERKIKQEEFKKSVQEKFAEQQTLILKRKQQMEVKNEMRLKIMEEKHKEKQVEAEKRRQSQEAKLKAAKEKNEQKLLEMKEEFLKKEEINEHKRKQFEEDRRKKIEERQIQAKKQHDEIAEVLEKMRSLEEQKKKAYLVKIDEAEQRKKQLELHQEEEKLVKKKEEEEREKKRIQVQELKDSMLNDKISSYLGKLTKKDENVERGKERRKEELLDKITNDNIKRFDRTDTVIKIQKMQNYQRSLLQDKIEDKMSRAIVIQNQKDELLLQRSWMRQEINKQKETIMEKMEKVKLGKINPKDFFEEFKKNSTSSTIGAPSPNLNRTFPKAIQSSQSPKKKQQVERMNHTAVERKGRDKQIIKLPNGVTEKEVEKVIQDLKQRQNVEMLRLLEEEQDNEYKREKALLEFTDQKEKSKQEKIQITERSKGQARIQKLADTHFDEVQKIRRQFYPS